MNKFVNLSVGLFLLSLAVFILVVSVKVAEAQEFGVGDGVVAITQSEDCFIRVEYTNWLANADQTTRLELGNVTIDIDRGFGVEPDLLTVTTSYGWTDSILVDDNSVEAICVPWPMMG